MVLRKLVLIVCAMMGLCSLPLEANDQRPHLELSSTDRILVIAPHPDDEVIGAAGVIQEAHRLNIPIRVMYVTNGDSNSLAFLYYKKRPVLGRKEAFEMGKVRQEEAVDAMTYLGLNQDQLIFLGYPDYGTLNIFRKYWKSKKDYRSVLTRVDHVPYTMSLSPDAKYNASSILADFKTVLLDFKPTKIFVTHPADGNGDHQAAYLFLRVALWDLVGQINDPLMYTYLVHATNWPRPLGFYPKSRLEPQKNLQQQENQWSDFELSSDQLEKKHKVIQYYKTQIPYKPKYLFTFVRANELFSDIHELELRPQVLNADTWAEAEEKQYPCQNGSCGKGAFLKSVVYALGPEQLNVRIGLNQSAGRDFKVDLYLFGYKKNVLFSEMPKIYLRINRDFQAEVFDGKKPIRSKGVRVSKSGNAIVVSLPLALLGDPEKVMGSANMYIQNLPREASTWRVMELNYGP